MGVSEAHSPVGPRDWISSRWVGKLVLKDNVESSRGITPKVSFTYNPLHHLSIHATTHTHAQPHTCRPKTVGLHQENDKNEQTLFLFSGQISRDFQEESDATPGNSDVKSASKPPAQGRCETEIPSPESHCFNQAKFPGESHLLFWQLCSLSLSVGTCVSRRYSTPEITLALETPADLTRQMIIDTVEETRGQ